jgi:hypothetical protein
MEHQIEIQFIHRRKRIFNFYWGEELIQTIPFEIGFLFKNRGSTPIQGATIDTIRWSSSSGQKIFSSINKSFHLDTLNPGEERKMWTGEKVGTYAHDLCHIDLNIKSDSADDSIKTFQVDPFTKQVDSCQTNSWVDFFFIRSKNEYEQSISNSVVVVLTCMLIVFSFLTLRLSQQQTDYIAVQSLPDRIQQAQSVQRAVELCKSNPTLKESGLYDPTDGTPASCQTVLQQYGK